MGYTRRAAAAARRAAAGRAADHRRRPARGVTTIGLVTVAAILGDASAASGSSSSRASRRSSRRDRARRACCRCCSRFVVGLRGSSASSGCVTPWARARAEQAATVMNEVIAWLTDPANWQGATGIPIRLLEHLAISGVSIARGDAHRAADRAVDRPHGPRRDGWRSTSRTSAAPSRRSRSIVDHPAVLAASCSREFGLELIPTFIAMVLLAIPPILVNAYAGLREVDRDLVEAARGMGMRERQILAGVELPLAVAGDHRRVPDGGRSRSSRRRRSARSSGSAGSGRFIVDGRRAERSTGSASSSAARCSSRCWRSAWTCVLAVVQRSSPDAPTRQLPHAGAARARRGPRPTRRCRGLAGDRTATAPHANRHDVATDDVTDWRPSRCDTA